MPKHIVLATWGSLGDLYPYIAIAIGLRRYGFDATIATSEHHRTTVESQNLSFQAIPPDIGFVLNSPQLVNRIIHKKNGFEYLAKNILLPCIQQTYQSLLTVCKNADMLISNELIYAAPLVAECLEIPWITSALQPKTLESSRESAIYTNSKLWNLNALLRRIKKSISSIHMRSRIKTIQKLRACLELDSVIGYRATERGFSRMGTLALFSPVLGTNGTDWPPNTQVTGFPFHNPQEIKKSLHEGLMRFLDQGSPPVVFTLGTTIIQSPGKFFETSLAVVHALDCRAVILAGRKHRVPEILNFGKIYVTNYAPFSALFSRSSAVVHQGGIGTLAYALQAGRPMLIVPHSFDQPDNARRAVKLGVARALSPGEYTITNAATELRKILEDPSYEECIKKVSREVCKENGINESCLAIKNYLAT